MFFSVLPSREEQTINLPLCVRAQKKKKKKHHLRRKVRGRRLNGGPANVTNGRLQQIGAHFAVWEMDQRPPLSFAGEIIELLVSAEAHTLKSAP